MTEKLKISESDCIKIRNSIDNSLRDKSRYEKQEMNRNISMAYRKYEQSLTPIAWKEYKLTEDRITEQCRKNIELSCHEMNLILKQYEVLM